jgi:hypothetical protein
MLSGSFAEGRCDAECRCDVLARLDHALADLRDPVFISKLSSFATCVYMTVAHRTSKHLRIERAFLVLCSAIPLCLALPLLRQR